MTDKPDVETNPRVKRPVLYNPDFTLGEDLGAPISQVEMQREQAFEDVQFWQQVAKAASFFAARFRNRRPLHSCREEAREKFGAEIAREAEKLIREAENE